MRRADLVIERIFKPDAERQLSALAAVLGVTLLPPPVSKAAPLPGSIAAKRQRANAPRRRKAAQQ